MQNARLDEVQAGIKIARRNINNLRYADDTTLMAESEEELKNLLMKVKEESEIAGLKLSIQKTGSSKKQESSRKTSISALLTVSKPLTVWITTNCGKFFKRWEYQTTWPASWETYMQVKKQQLELDIEQQTGSK